LIATASMDSHGRPSCADVASVIGQRMIHHLTDVSALGAGGRSRARRVAIAASLVTAGHTIPDGGPFCACADSNHVACDSPLFENLIDFPLRVRRGRAPGSAGARTPRVSA
jgi:hypothetical protein